jgi:hypothetical protein
MGDFRLKTCPVPTYSGFQLDEVQPSPVMGRGGKRSEGRH